MTIRLPFWTQCVFEVEDLGIHSMWGRIVDVKSGVVIVPTQIYSLVTDHDMGEWQEAPPIHEFMKKLKVK